MTQSLFSYSSRKRERDEYSLPARYEKRRKEHVLELSRRNTWFEKSIQPEKVYDLARLQYEVQTEPYRYLPAALLAVDQERKALAHITHVIPKNPSVLLPAELASRIYYDLRKNGGILTADAYRQAREAIRLQIESLIAAYRTTSASSIVDARKTLESARFIRLDTNIWLELHASAKDSYSLAKRHEAEMESDKARQGFTEALIAADYIDSSVKSSKRAVRRLGRRGIEV